MVLGEIWRGQGWEEVGCYPGGLVKLKREWYDGRMDGFSYAYAR
jgi:hypothetical protein